MQRTIIRILHLVLSIPILGYIYSPISQVASYAQPVRYIFAPAIILSGLWMYAGIVFSLIAVAVWIATIYLLGFLPAVLSQLILLVAWRVWLGMRKRKSKGI